MRTSLTPIAAALLAVAFEAPAQKEPAPCAVFSPAPPPCSDSPGSVPEGPPAVARLDGAAIALADLDDATRKAVEGRDAAVAEARRRVLRAEIDDLLLEREAERTGIPEKELWRREVVDKVAAPSPEELEKELAARPAWYLGKDGKPTDEGRASARGVLVERNERKRAQAYAASLETSFPVRLGVDAAVEPLPPGAVLANVGGRPLTAGRAAERLAAATAEARLEVFQKEKDAIDETVHARLLKAEAARRGVTPEELTRTEVATKLGPPNDAELRTTWEKYKPFFEPDFSKAKEEVLEFLQRKKKGEAEAAFDAFLRKGHEVRLLLLKPELPERNLPVAGSPSTGDAAARVTLVEWGDFQCPPCGFLAHLLDEVLPAYGGKVRYVFHQMPLRIHAFAEKAAEASLAAHAQGKFFPYAKILFANQKALDVLSLKRYAAQAGLDVPRFSRDLDSGRWVADVHQDRRAGRRAGVNGTPGIFVNGVPLDYEKFSAEGLRETIDAALAAR